jgi:hypothetical protein
MALTKSDIIIFYAHIMSLSDGEFSKDEITTALEESTFSNYYTKNGLNEFNIKFKSGELNKETALIALKNLSKEDQLETLAISASIMASDEIYTDEEYLLLTYLCQECNVTFSEVVEKLKNM